MSLLQQKQNQLIEEIRRTKDEEVLDLLQTILESRSKAYRLTQDELLLVEESRGQIKAGKSKAHHEVVKGLRKWLEEK